MEKGLCEICNPKQWKTISADMLTKSGFPVYGANGVIGFFTEYNHEKPTLLITCRGATCGSLNICEPLSYVNGNAMALDDLSEEIDLKYLYYFLLARGLSDVITGSAQPQIVRQSLTKIRILYPPLFEQHKMVTVLDEVSDLISLRKLQLAKLDELVKSRFIELFGDPVTNPYRWERRRFDQFCENLDNRRIPITSTDRKSGIYPYYGASGIVDYVDDYIFDENLLLVSEDGANLVMRSTPIAFSISGKAWVNNHAHVVRFDAMATQKYIEVCFALTDISGSITGTAQPKLNQAKLNAMVFCFPPLELQEQFTAFVEQTDKSKLAVQQGLNKLEMLKKALMQKYFECGEMNENPNATTL